MLYFIYSVRYVANSPSQIYNPVAEPLAASRFGSLRGHRCLNWPGKCGRQVIVPDGNTRWPVGDVLTVIAEEDSLKALQHLCNKRPAPI